MIEEFSGDFLQQLRGFYYVSQLGSMGQAAKAMHRSQSSVSRLIKQLEQSLGAELFSRVQKGVVLTNEGEELFIHTISIFEKIRSIHAELRHLGHEPTGSVALQVSHAAFISFIAPSLRALYQAYPKLHLNIYDITDFAQLQKKIEERSLDFCLAVGRNIPKTLDFDLLFRNRIILVVYKELPALKEPVHLENLSNLPIIRLPVGSDFDMAVDGYLPSDWLSGKQVLFASNMYYQLNMVAAGLGYAVTAEAALHMIKDLPLSVYPLDHLAPPLEYGLVYLRNSYITPQAKAVMDFLRKQAKKPNK